MYIYIYIHVYCSASIMICQEPNMHGATFLAKAVIIGIQGLASLKNFRQVKNSKL